MEFFSLQFATFLITLLCKGKQAKGEQLSNIRLFTHVLQ